MLQWNSEELATSRGGERRLTDVEESAVMRRIEWTSSYSTLNLHHTVAARLKNQQTNQRQQSLH